MSAGTDLVVLGPGAEVKRKKAADSASPTATIPEFLSLIGS